ncbi:WbqC family protein [Pontibacter sp. BT731]|uniref:WbqC family protein n=1 Tax=Pontibacter coccineus TaxID=3063328 RepID=UPI0026E41CCD|nr:WbqC family protein [Pontibacter sp. BT731]MDO6390229.1 WbqC family protein [Pontibacter sp. BT731]
MRVAIMQPYFLPYIGYFQLMNAVDTFVVYDNIEFSKKGWVQRNRYLQGGKDQLFSLPLKKDSDYLNIVDRCLGDVYISESEKLLRRLESSYRKAPYFSDAFPVIEKCVKHQDRNLFNFIFHSLKVIREYIDLDSELIVSSRIDIENGLKGEERVIATCKALGAKHYINAIGGIELYNKSRFLKEGIALSFIKSEQIIYQQFGDNFISNLSILDVMMFNDRETIKQFLKRYNLI